MLALQPKVQIVLMINHYTKDKRKQIRKYLSSTITKINNIEIFYDGIYLS
jgi:hypothetical protein